MIVKDNELQPQKQQPKQLSPLKNLKLSFKSLDTNQEGVIDKDILRQAIMYTGDNYDKEVIKNQIQKCEGKISLQKFIQIFQKAEIQMNQLMENQSLFKLYDLDKKGFIDKNDLMRVSEITGIELSQDEYQDMLNSNTTPGQVQFDQFAQIMNDHNSWF